MSINNGTSSSGGNFVPLAGLPSMIIVENLPFLLAPPSSDRPIWTAPLADSDAAASSSSSSSSLQALLDAERQRPFSQVIDGFLGGPNNVAAHTIDGALLVNRQRRMGIDGANSSTNDARNFFALPCLRAVMPMDCVSSSSNNKTSGGRERGPIFSGSGTVLSTGGVLHGTAAVDPAAVIGATALAEAQQHHFGQQLSVEARCLPANDILVKVSYKRLRVVRKSKKTGEVLKIVSSTKGTNTSVTPVAFLNFRVAFETPVEWIFDATSHAASSFFQQHQQQKQYVDRTLAITHVITTRPELRHKKRIDRNRCMSPVPTSAAAAAAIADGSSSGLLSGVGVDGGSEAAAAASSSTVVVLQSSMPASVILLRDAATIPAVMPDLAVQWLSRYKDADGLGRAKAVILQLLERQPMWAVDDLIDTAIDGTARRPVRWTRRTALSSSRQQQQQQQLTAAKEDDIPPVNAARWSVICASRLCSYCFSGGPLAGLRIRFGFDPRQHSADDSVVYSQLVVVKPDEATKRLLRDIKSRVPRATLAKKLADMDEDIPVTLRPEHIYYSRTMLAGKMLLYVTLRDLVSAPHIRGMVEAGRRRALPFDPKNGGFLTNAATGKIRKYLVRSLGSWVRDTVAPQLGEFIKLHTEFDASSQQQQQQQQQSGGALSSLLSSAELVEKWIAAGKEALEGILKENRASSSGSNTSRSNARGAKKTSSDAASSSSLSSSDDGDDGGASSSSDDDDEDDFNLLDLDRDGGDDEDDDEDESFASLFKRQRKRLAQPSAASNSSISTDTANTKSSPQRRERIKSENESESNESSTTTAPPVAACAIITNLSAPVSAPPPLPPRPLLPPQRAATLNANAAVKSTPAPPVAATKSKGPSYVAPMSAPAIQQPRPEYAAAAPTGAAPPKQQQHLLLAAMPDIMRKPAAVHQQQQQPRPPQRTIFHDAFGIGDDEEDDDDFKL